MIHISTFYAAVSDDELAFGVHPHAKTTHDQYIRMINVLFESTRYFHSSVRFSIISSHGTDLSKIVESFERIDVAVDQTSLMLNRTEAQSELVKQISKGELLVLVDSDIVVNGNLTHLIDLPFDIAVTWRRSALPINGGVLIAKNNGNDVAAHFFNELTLQFENNYFCSRQWNGDQLALRDMVPHVAPWSGQVIFTKYKDVRVALLHSEYYNYSPSDSGCYLEEINAVNSRFLVHFKGVRKRYMESYWHFRIADMLRASLPEETRR